MVAVHFCCQMLQVPNNSRKSILGETEQVETTHKESAKRTATPKVPAPWRAVHSLELKDADVLQRSCEKSWIGPVLLGKVRHVAAEASGWEVVKEMWTKSCLDRPLPVYTPLVPPLPDKIVSVCVTPDGEHVVSGSWDKTVRITPTPIIYS